MVAQILIACIVLSLWLQGERILKSVRGVQAIKLFLELLLAWKRMLMETMYWYRQRPGETMSLIVYTVYGGQPDYGGASQTKYTASKEKIDYGALTVKDLQPEDSGVYFCAVSNTVM
uniref:Ig-like domain-containing protein n=1 Tax=Amphiprion ocellaris TaxID=80972 RepID=A0A3Q1BN90_AMPOC